MLFKNLIILLLLFSNIYALDEKLKLGLLYEKVFSSKKEAQIGVKIWIKQSHIKKYVDNMEIVFYKDGKKLLEDFEKAKVSVVLINPTFYFENIKAIEKLDIDKWNMSRTEEKFEQLYLITNSQTDKKFYDKEIKEIYYKLDLSKVWLESEAFVNNIKTFDFEKKSKKLEKSKKLVFNQFFKKNTYSIVSKEVYDSMLELNPQIKSKIKVVKKSEPIFFRALGLTRKDLNPKFYDIVSQTIYKINTTKAEFKKLSFFNAQTIYILNDDDLVKLDKMHSIYFSKKGK